MKRYAHVVGFDDTPFDRRHRGNVRIVGAVYAGTRLDGVLTGNVRRDGANATRVLADLVQRSRFGAQLHAVLLQGIAFAGFNVVDIHALNTALGLPIVVVTRRKPDLDAIRRALLAHVPGGRRKWALVERAGPMEAMHRVWVQRAGISPSETLALLRRFAVNSVIPEPLRTAHLVAAGLAGGASRQRV